MECNSVALSVVADPKELHLHSASHLKGFTRCFVYLRFPRFHGFLVINILNPPAATAARHHSTRAMTRAPAVGSIWNRKTIKTAKRRNGKQFSICRSSNGLTCGCCVALKCFEINEIWVCIISLSRFHKTIGSWISCDPQPRNSVILGFSVEVSVQGSESFFSFFHKQSCILRYLAAECRCTLTGSINSIYCPVQSRWIVQINCPTDPGPSGVPSRAPV